MKTKSYIISSDQVLPSNEFCTSLQKNLWFWSPLDFRIATKGLWIWNVIIHTIRKRSVQLYEEPIQGHTESDRASVWTPSASAQPTACDHLSLTANLHVAGNKVLKPALLEKLGMGDIHIF